MNHHDYSEEKQSKQSEIINEQPSKSMQIYYYLAELHKRIREGERKAEFFLNNKRFIELSTTLESLEYLVKEYYKFSPNLNKDNNLIRSLNRLKKRE